MRTPEWGASFKSQNHAVLAVLATIALFCLLMCSCGGASVPLSPGIVVSVSPPTASVMVDGTQQFLVSVANSLNGSVTWSVNTTVGGNSTLGTISSTGLYTAPDLAPSTGLVTVTATSQADSASSGSAIVLLTYPAPILSTVSPTDVLVASLNTTLTVTGSGFTKASTVNFKGSSRIPTFVSSTQLKLALASADVATGGTFPISVTNPPPGGGTSNAVNFSVGNPVPAITSLSPASVAVGSGAQTLTIIGTGFVSTSTVSYNGSSRTPTFGSSTQLTLALTNTDVATAGTYPVSVTNPAPGGGLSNAVNFSVGNPVPAITSLSPTSVAVGSGAQTLTINGTGFLSTSTVSYNGSGRIPAFVNSTQLTLALASADVATGGTFPISVTNPPPGGGTSNAVNFSVGNPVPAITSISPTSVAVGSGAQTLTINGTGFLSTSTVSYNGASRTPAFVNSTQLTLALASTDVAAAGTFPVSVTNPAPGGGTSNVVNFSVGNPVPTITSLSPTSVAVGSGAQTLTINGTGFLSTSTVSYNGSSRTPTFVNSTQLTLALASTDVATAGTYPVTVTNPAPGGGTSSAVNFSVGNPVPTITSLSPTSVAVGSGAQTLPIYGTGFLSSSTVSYNSSSRTPTSVTSTELTIALSSADVATAGTFPVTVTNPAPGGGTSNSVNFTVNNPAPAITSLSPASIVVGSGAQTMTINGSGFVNTSSVSYNGSSRTPTFVNSTELTLALTSADVATVGTFPVTVTNPAPGGGTSNSVNFTVGNPVPTITSLSPSSVTAGSGAQTLTINGTGFLSTSTVSYNGSSRTPTFVNSTQLTLALASTDVATAGTYSVSVTNPTPGGGTSSAVTFTVNNPVPTLTSLSPSSAVVGAAAQTLTLTGTNFVASSTVTYNAVAHAATFVNSTQLTITLSTTDQATAGIYAVVVTNPAPAGGTSSAVTFTVNNPVPAITSLLPTSVLAGSGAQTLTINGTGFVSTSTVSYTGFSDYTVAYVSSSQLTVSLLADDVATAGTYSVSVTNPTPGGGTSSAATFTVNQAPAITSANNTTFMVGTLGSFTVTATGYPAPTFGETGSLPSGVTLNATTGALSGTPADGTAGTYAITITASNGVGSNATQSFTLTVGNPVPVITTLSPSCVAPLTTGQTLTINGSGFLLLNTPSTVTFGAELFSTPTFVSSTELQIALLDSDLANPTSYNVSVTNPATNPTPDGGTSNVVTFTVSSTCPSLTVAPSTAQLPVNGQQQFTAKVTGTSKTAVNWSVNGVAGGNATVGTISAAGLYTAPATAPATVPAAATVTATSQASSKVNGSASVKIGAFNEKLVYSFTGLTDGAAPSAALIQGSDGYYYGTALLGGANGYGTVFKVDSSGNVTPLHEFSSAEGESPSASLVQASDGSFYGTTNLGGAEGEGTIFKMDSSGNLTTLYSFTGGADGAQPSGGLIQASDGYLYGATLAGGASSAGVVFRSDTSGNYTTLYSFSGGTDGYGPEGSLIQATDGYFYGVTRNGGNLTCEILPISGCGTIFRIDSAGNLTTLYSFTGGADGANPAEALLQGRDGFFYGTTLYGGNSSCSLSAYTGCGTIFKIDLKGNFTAMHEFSGGSEGGVPYSALIQASDGAFYGTATAGGDLSCSVVVSGESNPTYTGCGTVFKMDSAGNVNGLYSFTGAPNDGANPSSSLLQGGDGYFYGTTKWGGTDSLCSYTTNGGCGAVFQVSGPAGP
ncbi:MAG: beta strand repeat-containing protein [Terriglobia bacterium]